MRPNASIEGSGQPRRPSQLISLREPDAAEAGGYVLAAAGVLVAAGLLLHPLPSRGLYEKASVLAGTPLWGPIHIAIALGCVLSVLGGLLVLVGGGALTRRWESALSWGAFTVGMIYFSELAVINGYVMHPLARDAAVSDPLLYSAFNDLLVGHGWMGNPLFLAGLTGLALIEWRRRTTGLSPAVALFGVVVACLSWLRGIGSATGFYMLEPFIFANIPAFLWLGWYGLRIAAQARAVTVRASY